MHISRTSELHDFIGIEKGDLPCHRNSAQSCLDMLRDKDGLAKAFCYLVEQKLLKGK